MFCFLFGGRVRHLLRVQAVPVPWGHTLLISWPRGHLLASSWSHAAVFEHPPLQIFAVWSASYGCLFWVVFMGSFSLGCAAWGHILPGLRVFTTFWPSPPVGPGTPRRISLYAPSHRRCFPIVLHTRVYCRNETEPL